MQLDAKNTQDLDALFEAAAIAPPSTEKTAQPNVIPIRVPANVVPSAEAFDVFQRIGSITRKLHDALQELGYDKQIADAVHSLPDARTRLDYIARLTGDAAEKVLNTVDAIQAEQDKTDAAAEKVRASLADFSARSTGTDAEVAREMKKFLDDYLTSSGKQREQLTEIMLAQDFHDLTGQVIRKIVSVAANLEEQLVTLLLEATPPEKRTLVEHSGLSGPVVDAQGRSDVVTNQAQVDDLLESLGF
jgi:chemotaxis protein CheZ